MAISEDRVKIPELTEKTIGEFKTAVDTPMELFSSLADKAKSAAGGLMGMFNSLKDAVTGAINGAKGLINSIVSGFESAINTVKGLVSKGLNAISNMFSGIVNAIPKQLSFNTKSLGFFENILCGKLPNLGLRLGEALKALFKGLNFSLNMTICGKSSLLNPIDGVLAITKQIKKVPHLLDGYRSQFISGLLNKEVMSIAKVIGLGKTANRLYDMVNRKAYTNTNKVGYSLGTKNNINKYFLTGTQGEYYRENYRDPTLTSMVNGAVLGQAFSGSKEDSKKAFELFSRTTTDKSLLGNSLKNSMDEGKGSSNTFEIISSTFGNKGNTEFLLDNKKYLDKINKEAKDKIDRENQEGRLNNPDSWVDKQFVAKELKDISDALITLGNNIDNTDPNGVSGIKGNANWIIKNIDNNMVANKDNLENIVTSLAVIDPNWDKDKLGRTSLFRSKKSDRLGDMSLEYLGNRDDTFSSNINKTTKTTHVHQMAILRELNKG